MLYVKEPIDGLRQKGKLNNFQISKSCSERKACYSRLEYLSQISSESYLRGIEEEEKKSLALVEVGCI